MPKLLFAAITLAATIASAQQRQQQPVPVGGTSEPTSSPLPQPGVRPPPAPAPMTIDAWNGADTPMHPRFAGEIGFAGGRFEHRTKGSALDDSTDALYFRTRFEGYMDRGFGAGIRFEGMVSDDNLFDDPGLAMSQADSFDLFVYVAYRPPMLQGCELPLRVGMMVNNYGLEEDATDNRIDYSSIGIRCEVMPDLALVENKNLRWSIYGGASAALGWTHIETDPDTFDSHSTTALFGFEAGSRLRLGQRANLGIGWIYRTQTIDDSDIENGNLFFRGIEQTFSGLLVTFGLTF